jgi:hypothetical protein
MDMEGTCQESTTGAIVRIKKKVMLEVRKDSSNPRAPQNREAYYARTI